MRYMYRGHDETYQAVPCYIYLFDGDGIATTTDTFCVGTVGWPPSAGIDSIEGENGVLLQPNPANNSVLLTSSEPLAGIEVYTIDGAFYKRLPAAGYAVDIDVSAWPSGTYLLHVGTTDGNLTRRLVVNH